mmetsp:Transcript_7825/g.22381  ORF Transcript_7825/g.22381 Transcript_7825/m.22381 type:complete len:364 (-) Transcript_7825:21-1112(-)
MERAHRGHLHAIERLPEPLRRRLAVDPRAPEGQGLDVDQDHVHERQIRGRAEAPDDDDKVSDGDGTVAASRQPLAQQESGREVLPLGAQDPLRLCPFLWGDVAQPVALTRASLVAAHPCPLGKDGVEARLDWPRDAAPRRLGPRQQVLRLGELGVRDHLLLRHDPVLDLRVVLQHQVGALGPVQDPQVRRVPAKVPPEDGVLPAEVVRVSPAGRVQLADSLPEHLLAHHLPELAAQREGVQIVGADVALHVEVPRVRVARARHQVAVVGPATVLPQARQVVARNVLGLRIEYLPQGTASARQGSQGPGALPPVLRAPVRGLQRLPQDGPQEIPRQPGQVVPGRKLLPLLPPLVVQLPVVHQLA